MSEQVEKEIEIYGYYGKDGKMYWTSNVEFATARAKFHGTNEVYVEKN